jgi:hypothetical protein
MRKISRGRLIFVTAMILASLVMIVGDSLYLNGAPFWIRLLQLSIMCIGIGALISEDIRQRKERKSLEGANK